MVNRTLPWHASTVDGSLDDSFDGDGLVLTDFYGDHEFGRAITTQSDGKIVVAGKCSGSQCQGFILARYNLDGSLDVEL